MITSAVRQIGGVPTLVVNDKPIVQTAYITYLEQYNCYMDFADCGYRLFSAPIAFASRTINEIDPAPVFSEGIFEKGVPDFEVIDKSIKKILDACPDALIFPRINVNLPMSWEDEHPEELCYGSYGEHKCVCFASDIWAQEVKRLLKLVIDHIRASDYKDHIVAYQISGGNTEEWFPMGPDGGDGKRAREAFDLYKTEKNITGTTEEYRAFLSKVVAQRIMEFAEFTKECTNHTLAVGSFYGYTMTCFHWESCHHALNEILSCPYIDFLCSPICYSELRSPGKDAYNMLPVDSVKLHNKLYFVENDSRTHLSKAPYDIPKFQHPVWYGPKEKEVCLEVLKMHFARALTHGHALWWFDMWGGWFNDHDYMKFMEHSCRVYENALEKDRSSMAEVAVFIDENSYALFQGNEAEVPNGAKKLLGLSATPYDIYLAQDFETVCKNYKAVFFIVPVRTELVLSNIKSAKAHAIPYIEYTQQTLNMKPEELMEFFASVNVCVYADIPCVVYASKSHLFLHTANEGKYNFKTNKTKTVVDVFTKKTYSFPCHLKAGQSLLFEIQ